MKKIVILLCLAVSTTLSYAGSEIGLLAKKTRYTHGSEGMLGNGLYLNMGLGFPKSIVDVPFFGKAETSLGPQISIELGNQWMFYRTDNNFFGVGMNVSWLTFGYSSYKPVDIIDERSHNINFALFRLGPMASFAFHEKMAVDVFFNVIPTANVSFYNTGVTESTGYGYGTYFAPGLRYRFSVLSVGFEYQFGKGFTEVETDTPFGSTSGRNDFSFRMPRITLGIKL
jgi:hypothetical protein